MAIIAAGDSGSGNIDVDDGSPNEDYDYGGDSNTGSMDADDEDEDDPLDEEYYDGGEVHNSKSTGGSVHVRLVNHATANPFLVLIVSLWSISVFSIKRK